MKDIKQIELGKSLIGKTLRFRHMSEPWGKVTHVCHDGMIEFDNKGGFFAPHLFVEVARCEPDATELRGPQ